jgi:BlaI family penicillinase repressor
MQKRAVRSERDDGRLTYRPLIDRRTYVADEVQALVNRLFDGDPTKLAAFLSEPYPVPHEPG